MQDATDIKYIRVTDFDDEGIVSGNKFLTAEVIDLKYSLKPEDVLFARSGATAGKTFIFTKKFSPAIFAGYCIRFRFDKSQVLPWYIYFYTKTGRYRTWVQSIQRPSGQPNINKEEFKAFTIPVPPLKQQELVAEMYTARETRKRKLQQADSLLASLDPFLLDQLDLKAESKSKRTVLAIRANQIQGPINPERYLLSALEKSIQGTTIGKVAHILESKIAPSKEAPNDQWDWIRIDDLKNQPLGVDSIRTEMGVDIEGTYFAVQENDILLARLGPTILNRKFLLCPKTLRKTIASGEFLVLRCKGGWNPLTVLWILRTSVYRDLIYSKGRGATPSRYRVNRDDLAALPFPIIDPKKQAVLATEVEHRIGNARRLRQEAAQEWQAAKQRFEEQLLRTQ